MNITGINATAALIKKISYTIAGVATIASYGTQVTLLLAHHVGPFSFILPATIDLLAIAATMTLMFSEIDSLTKKLAGTFLFVAVAVSIAANLMGAENGIAAAGHAWPVVAYLLAEILASRVRAFAAKLQAEEAANNAPVVIPVAAPVIVANPLPRATTARRSAPVATRKGSHATCGHAATAKDRAACRATR